MTSLLINKGLLKPVVEIPRSKSFANRALILAAVAKSPKKIHHLPKSTDVTFLMDALYSVGVQITVEGQTTLIKNSFPECETIPRAPIKIGEGGTTARFLACLLMKGSLPYVLVLGDRLKNRPWASFIKMMNDLGGIASLSGNELRLQGPISLPAHLEVDCSHTTQFASGLQLSHPESTIEPYLLKSSQSYWDLTLELIKDMRAQEESTVPLDWSSAAFPLAFAALNQDITLPNLQFDKFQADAKFLFLLRELGAIKTESARGLEIRPVQKSKSIKMHVSNCLDLVPALSFLLGHIDGDHELIGVENLVHKESDRLTEVRNLLSQFKRTSMLNGNILKIIGSTERMNERVKLIMPDDHRMVMAGTLFLLYHGGGEISPVEAVTKSFPEFFSLLSSHL